MLIKRKRRRLITIEDSDDSVKSKGERDFFFFFGMALDADKRTKMKATQQNKEQWLKASEQETSQQCLGILPRH